MKKTTRDLPQISSRNLISASRSFNRDISNNLLQQNSTKDTLAYRSLGKNEPPPPKSSNRNLNLGGLIESPSLKMPKKPENSKSMIPIPTNREIKILTVSKSMERSKKKKPKSGAKKIKPMIPPLNL
jgi:hypothetical protein